MPEQIAITANNAGVDHHQVISAVTFGFKESAADVTVEEGRRVLQAIRSIEKGELVLVEMDGGGWELQRSEEVPS